MALHLYNTLTRKKDPFTPIDAQNVRMYVCGPTVYDYAHIGNARPVIVFDVLFRLLRHLYGEAHVTYARNITDVDDKINARAAEEYPNLPLNDAIREVTTRTTAQFHTDIAALGVLSPTVEPTCTAHVPEMVAMIDVLIAKGFAYAAEGHVLLDTTAAPDYGQLSGRSLDEMIAGARVEVAPYKRHPADSVLWKPSSDVQPGWDSPWGRGRPGWHIECSAMAAKHLGTEFDIHGGGIDLVFPHHENELAQSRSAHGTAKMATIWMHNGFLQVEGEKMSKSLGNFVTINDVLKRWPGAVARHAMLSTHYLQPIDWTHSRLVASKDELMTWFLAIQETEVVVERVTTLLLKSDSTASAALLSSSLVRKLVEALEDDLNTPEALSVLRTFFKKQSTWSSDNRREFCAALWMLGLLRKEWLRPLAGGVIGRSLARAVAMDALSIGLDLQLHKVNQMDDLVEEDIDKLFRLGVAASVDKYGGVTLAPIKETNSITIEGMITARNAARKAKNFAEADRIRGELEAMGIQLKDTKNKDTGEIETTWEVRR